MKPGDRNLGIDLDHFYKACDQRFHRRHGLGAGLLDWRLERAWSYRPRRVWLHTCSLDHPRSPGWSACSASRRHREVAIAARGKLHTRPDAAA